MRIRSHDDPDPTTPPPVAMLGTLRSELDDDLDVPPVFTIVMQRLEELRRALYHRDIDRAQMAGELRNLKIAGPDGALWAPGASSGQWYRKTGSGSWVRSVPPLSSASDGSAYQMVEGAEGTYRTDPEHGDADVPSYGADEHAPAADFVPAEREGATADPLLPAVGEEDTASASAWGALRSMPQVADDGRRDAAPAEAGVGLPSGPGATFAEDIEAGLDELAASSLADGLGDVGGGDLTAGLDDLDSLTAGLDDLDSLTAGLDAPADDASGFSVRERFEVASSDDRGYGDDRGETEDWWQPTEKETYLDGTAREDIDAGDDTPGFLVDHAVDPLADDPVPGPVPREGSIPWEQQGWDELLRADQSQDTDGEDDEGGYGS